ncbi:MAG: ComEC family competence protein [Hyphomicrobiales bacterium]|nr:ComEC family competence protein [Hyphomicrobiales bacterium]
MAISSKTSNGLAKPDTKQLEFQKQPLRLRLEVYVANAIDILVATERRERVSGTLFHFAPLIFALGISVYFIAPFEPMLLAPVLTFVAFALASMVFVHHGYPWIFICAIALFFGGMSAGKIRTDTIANHSLKSRVTGQIDGIIVEVTRNQRGSPRYLIVPERIDKLGEDELPNTIRISAASKHRVGSPGDHVSGLARIQPISGPAFPGSFDFSFNSWFNGLGASGFFMGKPKITSKSDQQKHKIRRPSSLSTKSIILVNAIRSSIAQRIRLALPGESGDVAVALIIGDRTGINRKTQESLRSSGLAHVLAISGMHMALVSLTMVWAVRFVLALNMRLASHYPIKNWALFAGLITATSYLAISGMSVATERAWVMISVMILAAVISRKSITLRGVAIAALAILILQPESVLSPGFQMSFAAVASIIAAYEWLDERKSKKPEHPRTNRVMRFFFSLIFTSLIAGLATSLFAAYHFHRVAPFGVLTNLMAMPLISTIVMPMALLSLFLMPYGFDQIPLSVMGWGIEWVVVISDYVNSLGGNGVTGLLGPPVLPMAFIGLFFLTMLKTRLRIIGVMILLASTLFWAPSQIPDILLSEDGRAIAIQDDQGKLAMIYPKRNKFVRDIWLRAYSGDEQGEILHQGRCNKDICTAKTRQGALVYVVYDPDYLTLACNRADILLAPKLRWVNCWGKKPKIIIKRGQLEEFGSHAIYLRGDLKNPELSGLNKGEGKLPDETTVSSQKGFEVINIETAVSNTNRPWNIQRKGRAAFRQD